MIIFKNKSKGFTLIELLVVIAVIGLLASIVLVSVNNVRKKARDAKRLLDMKQIQLALDLYYDKNDGKYPGNTDNDCNWWDTSNNGGNDVFIDDLVAKNIMPFVPRDPTATGACDGYGYHHYDAGTSGCDISRGDFYVLKVTDMETSGNPHPSSPGWSCPGRDWQVGADWVVGKYER